MSGRRTARPPRTKPPAERRAQLMDAAQRLFLEQGFTPTSVERVTETAGVAKGTFYLYFSSKEAVRSALAERYGQAHLARTSVAVAQARAWEGKLLAWVQASADFYLDSIELHDMLFYQARSPTREGLVENKLTDQLEALLAAGNAARAWSVGDPRAAAVFLFAGVHAVVDDAVNRGKRIHRPRLLARLEGLCRAVVRGL